MAQPVSGFSGIDVPAEADLYRCVHCGLCLSSCPTYVETALEMESPRGRLALMKAVNEGRVEITPRIVSHWEMCLQCRACEAVCPSGVPYGRIMERTRAQVRAANLQSRELRRISRFFLRAALPHPARLRFGAHLIRIYQRSGLQKLLRLTRLLHLLPGGIAGFESQLPPIGKTFFGPSATVHPAQGEKKMTVALLSGCVMPLMQGPTMDATVRVLTRNGCDVMVPPGQGCCGALNAHAGDLETTRAMARTNIDSLMAAGVERVITSSAGCGSTMKEYADLLQDDPEYSAKAVRFTEMTQDVTEFLVGLPFQPPTADGQSEDNLPRPLPPGPRPAHHSRAPDHFEFHPWIGASRDGKFQPVLRRRRYLLDGPTRPVPTPAQEKTEQHQRHRSPGSDHRQPRLHATNRAGVKVARNAGKRPPRCGHSG